MGKVHIDLNNKTILVTGSPGFIGANLVLRLLNELSGGTVLSLDNMNDYYDPALKEYRLSLIEQAAKTSPVKHVFIRGSIADKALIDRVFSEYKPSVVVNLAAQAGVRYSIDHPDVYIESNLIGFYNILEACRHNPVDHLVYNSSEHCRCRISLFCVGNRSNKRKTNSQDVSCHARRAKSAYVCRNPRRTLSPETDPAFDPLCLGEAPNVPPFASDSESAFLLMSFAPLL